MNQSADENSSLPEIAGADIVGKTSVRYQIVLICIAAAFILYLDRVCIAEIVKTDAFRDDTGLSKQQIGNILGAFFFSYAFFQIPAGWLSDRFGARKMLTFYILCWSLMTAFTGIMTSFVGILTARLLFGAAQAGAYPTISATIRRWMRFGRRGQASSFVSLGGRIGGTVAPVLTAFVLFYVGWQETVWIYGGVGIFIAAAYWWIVHDTPRLHPRCSEEEEHHIGHNADEPKLKVNDILPMLGRCCQSSSLWLNSVCQFCINVGWVYLITWLPSYLKDVHQVDDTVGGWMVTGVLAMGMVGQPIGGWTTDWSVRQFGLRLGRVLPLGLTCLIASGAYVGCAMTNSVWVVLICCGLVSLMTDIGNPSNWAFMQDVGGRNTGAIFGWGNMWGNFGAGLSAVIMPQIENLGTASLTGEQLGFLFCDTAFIIAGLSALGMDATTPLDDSAK